MPRIKYYYDTETCNFEKARFTWKRALKTFSALLVSSAILASAVLFGLFYFYDTPKEEYLKQQNQELEVNIKSFEKDIDKLSVALNELHQKDNEFYRAILNTDRMDDDTWNNAGRGGGAEFKKLGNESMVELSQKIDQMETQWEMQSQSFAQLVNVLKDKENELQHIPSILPVSGSLISGFGMRMHPILKVRKLHAGLDFACQSGTPIYATGDGKVTFAGVNRNGYGVHININHSYGYETKYAHLSKATVRRGQKVKRGQLLGYSGNTGLSKGPHLHYEIRKDGKHINPIDYFYSDLSPEQFIEFKKLADSDNESLD